MASWAAVTTAKVQGREKRKKKKKPAKPCASKDISESFPQHSTYTEVVKSHKVIGNEHRVEGFKGFLTTKNHDFYC